MHLAGWGTDLGKCIGSVPSWGRQGAGRVLSRCSKACVDFDSLALVQTQPILLYAVLQVCRAHPGVGTLSCQLPLRHSQNLGW